jgi:hypothetical protein
MTHAINKRTLMFGSLGSAAILSIGANLAAAPRAEALPLRPRRDRFGALCRASNGAIAARFSDFAVPTPEGNICSARVAFPMALNKRLPVLVFCPAEGSSAGQYDQITGALAAQDFFVLTIDRSTQSPAPKRVFLSTAQQAEQRLRRFAEVRFMLDTIGAAAGALGPKSDLVDASRIGAIGHRDGAWIAAGLGGWDSDGAPSTATRDGRVHAVIGLLPSQTPQTTNVVAGRSPDGVSGMFIGNLSQMPQPARGSGLLGFGLPVQSTSFGGLIGALEPGETRRVRSEATALAAAIAAAVLFFDWTLRGDRDPKKELMSLDGRRVEGLPAPLQLRKA